MQVADVVVHDPFPPPPFPLPAQWLTTRTTTTKLQVKLSCILERIYKPIGGCGHVTRGFLGCNHIPVEQRLPCLLELLIPPQLETTERLEDGVGGTRGRGAHTSNALY